MTRLHASSVVSLLEAAYRPSLDNADWLSAIVAATSGSEPQDAVFAALERLHHGGHESLGFQCAGPSEIKDFVTHVGPHAAPFARLFDKKLVTAGSLREIGCGLPRETIDGYFGPLAQLGIHDVWGIGVTTPGGNCLVLCWPTAGDAESNGYARSVKSGIHLAAALRLREAIQRGGGPEPAAVLTPDGRLLHAEGVVAASAGVRARIVDGVRAIDRARGADRADSDRVLSLWPALVAGRFSLVDRVESDGRRFIVALPNALGAESPFSLSPCEQDVVRWVIDGASNKEIAYAMGTSVGAVSGSLTRASRKLRVKNRSELKGLAQRAGAIKLNNADETALRHGYVALPLGAPTPSSDAGAVGGPAVTTGQRAILGLLADGASNQAIASALGASPNTIRNRIAALSDKFGGMNRSELARWWIALNEAVAPLDNASG